MYGTKLLGCDVAYFKSYDPVAESQQLYNVILLIWGLRGRSVLWLYNTRVGGVNPEALVPKAAQKDEAVVGGDDETLRADLNALIQQVWDLTTMTAHVTGWRGEE